jgi:hypothetical protein
VSGLFSRDFFEMAKGKLAPGGRLVQWIHTYESSVSLVKLVVRTLRGSFEHGTTWVGPDDLVMVASREPQAVELPALTARMAQPRVRDDLARIHLQLPTTLLARQVHADETQRRFGGEGPVNTDDHNLLEYHSPIAYFVAADVRVPDSRRIASERETLELPKLLGDRRLTADEARDLYASLSWVHPPDDPLVRAAAGAWLDADLLSLPAAVAFAKATLKEGDVVRAREVLAPHVTASADPDVAALWLESARRLSTRDGAPFRPSGVDLAGAEAHAREMLAKFPAHERLQQLLTTDSW